MRRLVRARVLLVLTAVLAALTGCVVAGTTVPGGAGEAPAAQTAPAGGSAAPAVERIARAVFDQVNAARAERGLQPVAWNDDLATVAADWSQQMSASGDFEHQDLRSVLGSDRVSGFTSMGENIFTSTGPVPAGTIHVGWMRSDEHRVNVLNPGWDRLGVGVFCAADGSVWATQEFGRTVGADRPAVATSTPPQEPITASAQDGPSC